MPNDYPYIATADGGVIGYSGVTYDSQGRATGQIGNTNSAARTSTRAAVRALRVAHAATENATAQFGLPIYSWTGDAYLQSQGAVIQAASTPPDVATSFWPGGDAQSLPGANASGTPVAAQTYQVKLHVFKLAGCGKIDAQRVFVSVSHR